MDRVSYRPPIGTVVQINNFAEAIDVERMAAARAETLNRVGAVEVANLVRLRGDPGRVRILMQHVGHGVGQ